MLHIVDKTYDAREQNTLLHSQKIFIIRACTGNGYYRALESNPNRCIEKIWKCGQEKKPNFVLRLFTFFCTSAKTHVRSFFV